MIPSPHLGVWQLGSLLLPTPIIGIVLDQPITKSDSSYFFAVAQTVSRREDVPRVDESPTANPDSEVLVSFLLVSDISRVLA